jgi:hypothetical protein
VSSQRRPLRGGLDERAHRVVPPPDRGHVAQRAQEPLAQAAGAHGGARRVEEADEGAARGALLGGLEELERRERGPVEDQGVSRREAEQAAQMAEPVALGLAQIGERGPRRLKPGRHPTQPEALEVAHAEMGMEAVACAVAPEPRGIAHGERDAEAGEPLAKGGVALGGHEDLGGAAHEAGLEESLRAHGVLADPVLAGGDIGEGQPEHPRDAVRGEEVVVRGPVEILGIGERARRDHPDDLAAHQLLALGGRLHLLAHRDLLALPNELADIGVGGVMRDARHGGVLARGERDLQEARSQVRVLEEQLVEVAQPEQEQVVRVPALELPVLLHHGSEFAAAGVRHARRRAVRRS